MMKLKVLTIVGTRPELIKLSRTISLLDEHTDHKLAHTGQNYDYELNGIFFDDMSIRKPDFFLESAKGNAAQTIASVIEKSDELIEKIQPDALLLYGDTNSCLSVISAKRRKIPIFHLEAGNRCFDENVPEEINRKIVDHLSDVNFVHSEHARRYLLNEGKKPELIFKTGSPMGEILKFYKDKISSSNILQELNLTSKNYFVVSLHREENVDVKEKLNSVLSTLNALAESYNKKIIFSVHPRTQKRIQESQEVKSHELINFMKPLGFSDYINLQANSFCTISDSGTITEESSYLGFPAINIREAHERPEGMDVGAVILSGLNKDNILRSIELATKLGPSPKVYDYNDEKVSEQVLKTIYSYTHYINRTVWKK